MIPSPTDIAYFIETANTANLSRAAERLGISQPSLSLAMQRLERAVGENLFHRSKRGISLTPAGRQLLAQSKLLLQSWEEVAGKVRASMHEVQGNYTIGCHQSVALTWLPRFVPQLLVQHPQLDIRFRHDLSRKVAESVISAEIDMGIVINPVRHPDLVIHKIGADAVTLWTVEKGRKSSVDTLICNPGLAQTQAILAQMKKCGIGYKRILQAGDLEVIAALTAAGCGAGIMPACVAQRAAKPLRRIAGMPTAEGEHCVLFRAENKNIAAIQALSLAIRSCFSSGK